MTIETPAPLFSAKELRYMAMAQHYYANGQSDLVAYAVIVKLMKLAAVTPTTTFTDPIPPEINDVKS